jgi:hypothetical protein
VAPLTGIAPTRSDLKTAGKDGQGGAKRSLGRRLRAALPRGVDPSRNEVFPRASYGIGRLGISELPLLSLDDTNDSPRARAGGEPPYVVRFGRSLSSFSTHRTGQAGSRKESLNPLSPPFPKALGHHATLHASVLITIRGGLRKVSIMPPFFRFATEQNHHSLIVSSRRRLKRRTARKFRPSATCLDS